MQPVIAFFVGADDVSPIILALENVPHIHAVGISVFQQSFEMDSGVAVLLGFVKLFDDACLD